MGKFKIVENLYRTGGWKKNRVKLAVSSGWITAEEYKQITGEEYEAEQVTVSAFRGEQ